MSYTRTDWKDGTTPIDATNMNKIEDGIAANADDISSLNDDLANITRNYSGTVDDMLSDWAGLDSYKPVLFGMTGAIASTLINTSTNSRHAGMVFRNGSNYDYILWNYGAYIYAGRITSDGTISSLYRFSGTSYLSASSTGDPVVMGEEESAD